MNISDKNKRKNMGLFFSNKSKNKITGNIGEAKAYAHLMSLGYEILETNFKTKIGEIDIIAKDENRIVFVEVKARATAKFGYPREALTKQKQYTIKKVAEQYLLKIHKTKSFIRFDVIEVLGDDITHLKHAF